MKRIFTGLTAITYLYGFIFCLCYAAAMGGSHPAASASVAARAPVQSDDEHEECSHHDQAGDHDQPHHGQSASDACCVKFLQDTPGLLPETFSKTLPTPVISLHFQPLSIICIDIWQNTLLFRNHSPPGLALQDPLLSPLSPRAPPFPA